MLKEFFSILRLWSPLDHLLIKLAGRFTTLPATEFSRFTRSLDRRASVASSASPPDTSPIRPPVPDSASPAVFELRWARLQQAGEFDAMWNLLAEDAQRAWGGRDRFVEGMRRQSGRFELLEAVVRQTEIVPSWTDAGRRRTYSHVARVDVRYRVRQDWREVNFDRQVHLVPAADGWRTLCYPSAADVSTPARSLRSA